MAEQSPKRYEPSARKLQYLRSLGIHPSSRMLSGLLAMLSGGLAVVLLGPHTITGPLTEMLRTGLGASQTGAEELIGVLARGFAVGGVAVLPAGLGALVGWLVGNALQTGFAIRWPGAAGEGPGYYTIPAQRRGDIAVRGILAAMLLVGTFVTIAAVCGAAAVSAGMAWHDIMTACLRPVVTRFVPTLAAVIILDIVWCRYTYMSAAAMSEQERRRESAETGTSWLTRWRRDRARRDGGRR